LKIEYINGYKFARMSDYVFSEVLTNKQFKEINPENIEIIYSNNSHISYQKNQINISDGDTIFCINSSLELLFYHIKNENLSNLTLITSQTDTKVSKNILRKLPRQFIRWYSINVNCVDPKLIPIPLGLSNGYDKNLDIDNNLINIEVDKFTKRKDNLLYLSFADNTNIRLRSGLKNYFSQYKWAKILYEKNEIVEYEKDLKDSNFVLCPQGNGIDTHRIWETLYCGSIPILEDHIGFNQFKKLPVMFVDDFTKLSEKSLENYLETLEVKDLDLIDFNYWKNEIFKKNYDSKNTITITINKKIFRYMNTKNILKEKVLRIKNGYFRIVYKFKNKLFTQI
tara:strand:+ start:30236 stop:31252 length:1017 start_codon:yes stop_codon:yes gene_type:complete